MPARLATGCRVGNPASRQLERRRTMTDVQFAAVVFGFVLVFFGFACVAIKLDIMAQEITFLQRWRDRHNAGEK